MVRRIRALVVLVLVLALAALAGEAWGIPEGLIAVPILVPLAAWAYRELGVE